MADLGTANTEQDTLRLEQVASLTRSVEEEQIRAGRAEQTLAQAREEVVELRVQVESVQRESSLSEDARRSDTNMLQVHAFTLRYEEMKMNEWFGNMKI